MEIVWFLLYTTLAYLIGSIPSAIWLGQLYFGIDIRDHGSGSASHLNVERVLGQKASWLVRLTDITKGVLAARLAWPLGHQIDWMSSEEGYLLSLTLGLAAMLGHIFPILAGFRGGKGYHVAIGTMLIIHPALICVFLGMSWLTQPFTKSPKISYLIAALSVPVFVIMTRSAWDERFLPMLLFGVSILGILLHTYRESLQGMRFRVEQIRRPTLRRP